MNLNRSRDILNDKIDQISEALMIFLLQDFHQQKKLAYRSIAAPKSTARTVRPVSGPHRVSAFIMTGTGGCIPGKESEFNTIE